MIKFYIDIETTGLLPWRHGIIEIGAIAIQDNEILFEFNEIIKPFENDEIDPKAIELTGIDYSNGLLPAAAFNKLIKLLDKYVDKFDKLDKMHFIAYYGSFDSNFLRKWFYKCGNSYFGSYFFTPPIDIASIIAYQIMDKRKELKDFKLITVAKYFDIDIKNSHRAKDDILAVIEIEKKLFSLE